jgi:UDP:flavonoid glycosyltransferase YjiC (YdhE family)
VTRIIMGATPVNGHVLPIRSIATDLVRRGHQVTVVTGSVFRDLIADTGARFVPLRGAADYDSTNMIEAFPGLVGLEPGLEQLNYYVQKLFVDSIPGQHEIVQELLAEAGDEPTVVINEMCFSGLWPIQLGAPGLRPAAVVTVGVSVIPLYSPDTAPFGLGLHPDNSPEGRQRNLELNRTARAGMRGAQDRLVEVLGGLGATRPAPFYFDGQVLLPDAYLQLSVPGLEYPRENAPDSLRCVGALPVPVRQADPPKWWSDVLDADRVILVTQGTLANQDFDELIRPALRALASLDALIVVTTGRPADDLGPVPANARVAEYIPYDELLQFTDVVISNGGYGGVQQTLSQGVPMVLAGDTEDKRDVTAQAAYSGAAINLATGHPAEADIRKAVDTVLAEPSYRRQARRLRAEYASHDPFAAIASTVAQFTG